MELSVTMLPVFWDVDTLDWKSKNIDSILSIAQKQVHDDSIILMHDGYQTSVDAALKIADLFTEKAMFLSLQTSSCSHKRFAFSCLIRYTVIQSLYRFLCSRIIRQSMLYIIIYKRIN